MISYGMVNLGRLKYVCVQTKIVYFVFFQYFMAFLYFPSVRFLADYFLRLKLKLTKPILKARNYPKRVFMIDNSYFHTFTHVLL